MSDQLQQFILYTTEQGNQSVRVRIEDETVWLTQKQMAELFGIETQTINYHLREIFDSGELLEDSVTRKFRITASDSKEYLTNHYNLDAIISVGYRVNSKQATLFRRWATSVLRDYIIKGFALDDELLKNGTRLGVDYFRELLERVRSIRASERRIYQQITDIFIECAIDYQSDSTQAQEFFATVQNKFHFAIHGQTAAERIASQADSNTDNMGLTTWKNSPDGRILKSDVGIAKNYLAPHELTKLERTITSYFDYIENQIEKHQSFTMGQLADSVVKFLEFNDFEILSGKGSISHTKAVDHAEAQYDIFNTTQQIDSDFDKFVAEAKRLEKDQ